MNNDQIKTSLLVISAFILLNGCGIYKPYTSPEIKTDGLYRDMENQTDNHSSTLPGNIGELGWQELFTDPHLQDLISQALIRNTDMRIAYLRVTQTETSLTASRLSFLPSFNLGPQGSITNFDSGKSSYTYSLPINASWEVDIFARLLNAKRRAKAVLEQSEDYRQAVQTQLIATVANTYYSLLLLDSQLKVSEETARNWKQNVNTMQALKDAGMTNEASVSQSEANYYAIEASLFDLQQQIYELENSLANLLGDAARSIPRGRLSNQVFPQHLSTGIPVELLSNRPDVRSAESTLKQAYYTTAEARSSFYPSLVLNGSAGWTNSAGSFILNPGKLLLTAVGSLTQPIFNRGTLRARLKISKAQQEEAALNFQQAILNAGSEVINALKQVETARSKTGLREMQITSLKSAVESSELLMRHGSSTYLEVLTAQQTLLSARLTQLADRFEEIQGIVNLYHALGGGSDYNATPTGKAETN